MAHVKQPKHLPGNSLVPRIFRLFEDKQRHLLIGEVALDTHYRLEVIEWQMEVLVQSGSIRHVSPEERKELGLHPLTVAYVKTKPGRV